MKANDSSESTASKESTTDSTSDSSKTTTPSAAPSADNITINETVSNSSDGEHAITADGESISYSNIKVEKTGEADGDEAD